MERKQTGRDKRRVFVGLAFAILAIGQLCFACIFTYHLQIISEMGWWTLNTRRIFPWIALASFIVFASKAWRAFVPKRYAVASETEAMGSP